MNNEIFKNKIGIIGAGKIGQSLILKLLEKDYPYENIKLTYNGSIYTFSDIYDNNLVDMISTNEKIIKTSDIVILSLPPQSFKQLGQFNITDDKLIISFMAGINIETIKKQTGSDNVVRIIPTGPDTINNSQAIAGTFPHNAVAEELFDLMDFDYCTVDDDEQMNIVAIAGCLPAVYCKVDPTKKENIQAIKKISEDLPQFIEISKKAEKLVPSSNKDEFIKKFSTRGGVTEAIITSLDNGDNLYDALLKGIKRNKELGSV